jgi:hypothetical protein
MKLVIDLNGASLPEVTGAFPRQAKNWESEKDTADPHGPRNAFDGGLAGDRFWETGVFPTQLTLDFAELKSVQEYAIYGHNSPERMPKVWILEAFSTDSSMAIPYYVESRNTNLVAFNGYLYSVPTSLGLNEEKSLDIAEVLELPGVFVKKEETLTDVPFEDSELEKIDPSKLVLLDSKTVNIVKFAGRLYSVPQDIGTISLEQWRGNKVTALPGVFDKLLMDEPSWGEWVEIDRRKLEEEWGQDEKRTFSVRTEKEYKKFRFTFTKGFSPSPLRLILRSRSF